MVFGIFIVILTFASMIVVHELGHLISAKLCGVDVKEFAVGFGPKLFSRPWRGTEYSIRVIPLGGFNDIEINKEKSGPTQFYGQPLWKRVVILVMGSVFNIISAFVALLLLSLIYGVPVPGSTVSNTLKDSPAYNVFLAGDKILSIDDMPLDEFDDKMTAYVKGAEKLRFVVEREGETLEFSMDKEQGSSLGIMLNVENRFLPLDRSIEGSWTAFKNIFFMFKAGIEAMLNKEVAVSQALSGPVGVSNAIYQANDIYGIRGVLIMFAIISINLGIMNLLPIPILDGGHIVLQIADVAIEKTVGKTLTDKQVEYLSYVGATLLGALFLLGLYADIMRMRA